MTNFNPSEPPGPEGVDAESRTLPPYEGRREAADIDGQEESTTDGAKTGGATGPVEDAEQKAPDPADTPRGATGSPADEQPASDMPESELDDDRAGPAHESGTGRAEDKP
jgi:hypothetical protein